MSCPVHDFKIAFASRGVTDTFLLPAENRQTLNKISLERVHIGLRLFAVPFVEKLAEDNNHEPSVYSTPSITFSY